MINRSLQKIEDFQLDIKYYEQELVDREKQSDNYLNELPVQMNGMFKHIENLVDAQEKEFYSEIT